jgi:hypothetical protein
MWEYAVEYANYKVTKKGGLFGDDEGYYVLSDGHQEAPLEEGLQCVGGQGWELVAIQPWNAPVGGGAYVWLHPSYIYIFKRPKPQSSL